MEPDVEIEIIGTVDRPPSFSEETPIDSPEPTKRPLLPLALLVALVLTVVGIALFGIGDEVDAPSTDEQEGGAQSANSPEVVESESEASSVDPISEPDSAPEELIGISAGGQSLGLTYPSRPSDGSETLVVGFAGSSRLLVVDLGSGDRIEWFAPEPLENEELVALGNTIVVAGESRAWSRSFESGSGWVDIGAADVVRPSSKPDRVWLRTENEKTSPHDADLLWEEVDLEGTVHRSMLRSEPLNFETPELVQGFSGIFRLTEEPVNPWRLLADYATAVAIGLNDVVADECNSRLECDLVWIDTATGERKGAIYSDLANNIGVPFGARLSPDGRFVIIETDAGGTDITSIASGAALRNSCLWDESISWTSQSELVACAADDLVLIYSTDTGGSIGLSVLTHDHPDIRVAFVPAA